MDQDSNHMHDFTISGQEPFGLTSELIEMREK